jgi:hypothetical protein
LNETLADKFYSQGYETYYGSDDSAWSTIDKGFGSRHVTKPPENTGVLLIGIINEFLYRIYYSHVIWPYYISQQLCKVQGFYGYDTNHNLHKNDIILQLQSVSKN